MKSNELEGLVALIMGAPDAVAVLIAHLHLRGLIDLGQLADLYRDAAAIAADENPHQAQARAQLCTGLAQTCVWMSHALGPDRPSPPDKPRSPDGRARPDWLRGVITGGKND